MPATIESMFIRAFSLPHSIFHLLALYLLCCNLSLAQTTDNPSLPTDPQTITYNPAPVADPLPTPTAPTPTEPVIDPTPTALPTPIVATPAPLPVKPATATPVKPAPVPVKPQTTKPVVKPAPKKTTTNGQNNTNIELIFDNKESIIKDGQLLSVPNKQTFKINPQNLVNKQLGQNSERRLVAWLKSLDHKASPANWELENNQWVARQGTGISVDRVASRANLLAAIKNNKTSAQVVFSSSEPKRNLVEWYKLGIRYHFGGGTSNFYGSRSFRVVNILAGVAKINGTYIGAGQVFNFNRVVGPTTPENGFVKGYIISGGTLAKDFGGGICQVSTTMFRAAYNSGLPILQRSYHSYRVHFYDPIGFEATVFAPNKNLQFLNDTGSPLFIQASWNTRRGMLSFNFFGRSPDRRAVVSNSYVYNRKAPGVARFIADEEVPLGRVRGVDNPEQGMDVIIYRTVYMNNGTVRKDQTRSHYVPWGAIFAVNPRDWRAGKNVTELANQRNTGNSTRTGYRRTGTTGSRTGTYTGSRTGVYTGSRTNQNTRR